MGRLAAVRFRLERSASVLERRGRALVDGWQRHGLGDVAGSLAFSGVLALFPFLVFLVALGGVLLEPSAVRVVLDDLDRIAPQPIAQILGEQVENLTRGRPTGLLTAGGLGAIWAGSGGIAALIRALNEAFGVRETRPFWKVRALALLTAVGGALTLLVAVAVTLLMPVVARLLGGTLADVLLWLRLPVVGIAVTGCVAFVYAVLPDVHTPFAVFTRGSVAAVAIWISASIGFSAYVRNFGKYQFTYGALGGGIVLLLWMWMSAAALLVGAEINGQARRAGRDHPRSGARPRRVRRP